MGAEIDRLEVEIEASASKANAQLDKLLGKLDKISGSLSGIDPKKLSGLAGVFGQSSSGAGKGVSTTRKLSGSFSQLSGRITKSQKSLSSFSQAAGKFYANSFLIIRGLKKLGSSIEQSMDYVETYNYFAVTMDKIGREFSDMYEQYGYDSAEAYANSFSGRLNELTRKMTGYSVGSNGELTLTDSIGLALDPQKIMDYQASIAAVTNSVGLCGETSTNTAKALTMLAADMSSLKNVNLSTAMTNFQSGLIGQSRALYKYGIDITNNTLQTYAYSLGLSKAVSEMTQAEKMQLRLVAILDQSKVAWGDQARTINSVANQYRILKQQVSNLARVIGNLFLPIVQKVLPVVNGLVIALQRLFTTLGFKLWGGNWLKDTMEGISGVGGGDALDDLADSADDTAGGLKDASKAAEKLKTIVRGIDELNIISPNTDTGSGSGVDLGTEGIDLSDAIGAALADYESVWEEAFQNSQNKAQEYADAICAIFTKAWKAIEPFRNAIVNLWDNGLSKLANFAWTGLKDFYEQFLVPIGTWAFGTEDSGLTRFVNVINDGLMSINWDTLSSALKKFWDAIEPYAEQFGEGLIDFFQDIQGLAVDVINKFPGIFQGIADALNSGNPETARSWGYALGELWISLSLFKAGSKIASGISLVYKAIKTFLAGDIFNTFSAGIASLFGSSAATSALNFLPAITKLVTGIGSVFTGLSLAVSNFFLQWKYGFSWIKEGLMVLGTALAAIGAVILGVPAGIAAAVAGTIAAIATIAVAIHDNWDSIKSFFTTTIPSWWSGTALPWIQSMPEKFGEMVESIGLFLSELPGKIGFWLGEALGSFARWVSDTSMYLAGRIPEIVENVENWFSELPGKIYDAIILVIDKFGEWKDNAVAFITEKVPEITNKILEFFEELPSKFAEIGKNIIFGLWQGIKDTWSNVETGIRDFCTNFLDGFREGWDINSPSRKMTEIAEYAILGLLNPFKDSSETMQQIYAFADSVLNIFREQLSPENFSLIAENAILAFSDTFNLGFKNMQFVSTESMQILSMSVVNTLTQMSQSITTILTAITATFAQKWAMMLLQTRNSWMQINSLNTQNLALLNNTLTSGMSVANARWVEKWNQFVATVRTACAEVLSSVQALNASVISMCNSMKVAIREVQAAAVSMGSISVSARVSGSVRGFASGGFPETGEYFLARENGINELVGRIGNRSAVANNDQIVQAITAGVANGINADEQNALLREQNELLRAILAKDLDVQLDGRSLVTGMNKAQKRMGHNFQPA